MDLGQNPQDLNPRMPIAGDTIVSWSGVSGKVSSIERHGIGYVVVIDCGSGRGYGFLPLVLEISQEFANTVSYSRWLDQDGPAWWECNGIQWPMVNRLFPITTEPGTREDYQRARQLAQAVLELIEEKVKGTWQERYF